MYAQYEDVGKQILTSRESKGTEIEKMHGNSFEQHDEISYSLKPVVVDQIISTVIE